MLLHFMKWIMQVWISLKLAGQANNQFNYLDVYGLLEHPKVVRKTMTTWCETVYNLKKSKQFQKISFTFLKIIFLNGPSRPLFRLSSFQASITIFTTNKCEKYPFSIRCRDLHPPPSEHESPPITTRPGFPPLQILFVQYFISKGLNE